MTKANQIPVSTFPKHIPARVMVRILKQYAQENELPLDVRRWESIVRCYQHYNNTARLLN